VGLHDFHYAGPRPFHGFAVGAFHRIARCRARSPCPA
jgi:hypothetical protein